MGQSKYKTIINIKVFFGQRTNFGFKIGCEKFGCLISDLETSRSDAQWSSTKQIATSEFKSNYFSYNLLLMQICLVLYTS